MDRHPVLSAFLMAAFGLDKPVEDTISESSCVNCKGPATTFDDDLSRKEYGISGLCQTCQDVFFADPEDDEDGERY